MFEKLKKIIVDQLDVDESEVKLESRIVDDLGADSLAVVELIMMVEEGFNLEIPDEQAEKMKTVGDMLNYIEKNK